MCRGPSARAHALPPIAKHVRMRARTYTHARTYIRRCRNRDKSAGGFPLSETTRKTKRRRSARDSRDIQSSSFFEITTQFFYDRSFAQLRRVLSHTLRVYRTTRMRACGSVLFKRRGRINLFARRTERPDFSRVAYKTARCPPPTVLSRPRGTRTGATNLSAAAFVGKWRRERGGTSGSKRAYCSDRAGQRLRN